MKKMRTLGSAAFLLLASNAWGAVFDVDRFDDTNAAVACTAAANDCSLRGAIITANGNGTDGDTINLPAGTYTLSIDTFCEDAALNGDLDIIDDLEIIGSGTANTILDADGIDRVFDIVSQQQSFNVAISELTIRNGVAHDVFQSVGCSEGGDGGNIRIGSSTGLALGLTMISAGQADRGGGIFNNGIVALVDSTVDANEASFDGGGLANAPEDLAIIINSTISRNRAGEANGSEGNGGGIANLNAGDVLLGNSTVSGNMAFGSDIGGNGGGIFVERFGTVALRNVTITENTADAGGTDIGDGGGVGLQDPDTAAPAAIIARNSIIAGNNDGSPTTANVFPDCFNQFSGATLTSEDFNLIGDETGCEGDFTGANDQIGTGASPIDPLLDILANYGGPTETHRLLLGSLAIDGGNNIVGCTEDDAQTDLLESDQRSFERPVDGDGNGSVVCDIGAFEVGACGDGEEDSEEECDDGNNSNTDACLNTCEDASCGDGFVRAGLETCDDGNNVSGDGCSSTCFLEGGIENLLGVGGCSLVNR